MSTAADYQTDLAQGKPNPSWKAPPASGGCGCTGGRRHRKHKLTKRGGVGVVDDALFAVGTSYAAKRFGQKRSLRRTRKRGGAGVIDDALVAGTAVGLAHYFTKKGKKGGFRRRSLPIRRTRRSLV
jgi:hypothetical protein